MADTEQIGKIYDFTLTDAQLEAKIAEYKRQTAAGEIVLPSWPDFCAFVDCDSEVLEDVMVQGLARGKAERSAYYTRARALKSMRRWCEAQLVSNPNWGGKMGVKSMMLLKQGFGGGRKYMDERTAKPAGPGTINIRFGGADPRGKKAGK